MTGVQTCALPILIRRLHRRTRTGLIAFCLLSSAFLSCAQTQVAAPPLLAPSPSPFDSLRLDITRATQRPGVQRGTWGIVVHSVDRDERLFELQPHALLVPASLAKLATVATRHRERIIAACAECICADAEVTASEAELLRGIADLLDCPMPPYLSPLAEAAPVGETARANAP